MTSVFIQIFDFEFSIAAVVATVEQSSANLQLYSEYIGQVLLLCIDYIALHWIHLHQWIHRRGR